MGGAASSLVAAALGGACGHSGEGYVGLHTALLVIVAFFALSAQISAQRRLRELLDRQREFTTRVTHELKTPIAGIKVMAETCSLALRNGAWAQETAPPTRSFLPARESTVLG